MRRLRHKAVVLLLCLAFLIPARPAAALDPPSTARENLTSVRNLLTELAMGVRKTTLDCSHLVHYLYNRVGLRYTYAESRKLYQGVAGFTRVLHPQAGDLIVWRGHVGIVVDPQERSFVSALRTGVKVAQYDSRYWKKRGSPRFFRYAGRAEHTQQREAWAFNPAQLDSYISVSSGTRTSQGKSNP